MKKIWHDEAWEEYVYWQTQDKKTLKKIIGYCKALPLYPDLLQRREGGRPLSE